jgi:hypothetical protein
MSMEAERALFDRLSGAAESLGVNAPRTVAESGKVELF